MKYIIQFHNAAKCETLVQWALYTGHAALFEILYTEQPQTLDEILHVLERQCSSSLFGLTNSKYFDREYSIAVLNAAIECGLVKCAV